MNRLLCRSLPRRKALNRYFQYVRGHYDPLTKTWIAANPEDVWQSPELWRPEDAHRKEGGPLFHYHAGRVRVVYLDEEKWHNRLTLDLIREIRNHLEAYERSELGVVSFLRARRGSHVFVSGPDLFALYQAGFEGEEGTKFQTTYLQELYNLIYRTTRVKTPWLPCFTGISYGVGAGLGLQSLFRVACHDTTMAFPETGYGLIPDYGSSFLLSKLEGSIGMFLVLTGLPIHGLDIYDLEISTHFSTTPMLDALQDQLELSPGGMRLLAEYLDNVHHASKDSYHRKNNSIIFKHRDDIEKCFSQPSVEEIFESLEKLDSKWSKKVLATLKTKSPKALKIAHRLLRISFDRNLPECLHQDYIITQNLLKEADFYTAVETKFLESIPSPRKEFEVGYYPSSEILQVQNATKGALHYRINTSGASEAIPSWTIKQLQDVSDSDVDQTFLNTSGFEPLFLESYDQRFDSAPLPNIPHFTLDHNQTKRKVPITTKAKLPYFRG